MSKRRPSGDGMVRKRADGRWEGRIVVGHKENGDSIFHYTSAGSQRELAAKLRISREAYRDANLTERSKMTLAEWLEQWLKEYAAPTVRESTLEGYRQYIDCHIKPRLGSKQVSKITAADVQKLYKDLREHGRKNAGPDGCSGLAASTVRKIHGILHEAMDAAKRKHLIAQNPTEGAVLPRKDSAPMKVLNDAQLERFMEEIKQDNVWHDFFYTELTTGLRRGEICGLMWSDFDAKAGTLSIRRTVHEQKGGVLTMGETKTGKGRRIITLPPSTAELLRERKKHAPSQWIFPDPLRPERPARPGRAYTKLKELLK